MMFMPLMIIVIGVNFGAGLALYWVVQNVFGIVQQYFITGWGALWPKESEAGTGSGSGTGTSTAIAAGRDGPATPAGPRSLLRTWTGGPACADCSGSRSRKSLKTGMDQARGRKKDDDPLVAVGGGGRVEKR